MNNDVFNVTNKVCKHYFVDAFIYSNSAFVLWENIMRLQQPPAAPTHNEGRGSVTNN